MDFGSYFCFVHISKLAYAAGVLRGRGRGRGNALIPLFPWLSFSEACYAQAHGKACHEWTVSTLVSEEGGGVILDGGPFLHSDPYCRLVFCARAPFLVLRKETLLHYIFLMSGLNWFQQHIAGAAILRCNSIQSRRRSRYF